jgi:hypothetical protein
MLHLLVEVNHRFLSRVPLLRHGHDADDKNHHTGREEHLLTAVILPFDELKLLSFSMRERRGFQAARGERVGGGGCWNRPRYGNPRVSQGIGVRGRGIGYNSTRPTGRVLFERIGGTHYCEQEEERCAAFERHD